MERELWDFDDGDGKEKSDSSQNFPLAEIVSLESLINVLLRKGICTPEELYQEEQRRRQGTDERQDIPVARTDRPRDSDNGHESERRHSSWLKRKMSKRKWTRRLGTALLGWRWRKVKINKGNRAIEHSAQ